MTPIQLIYLIGGAAGLLLVAVVASIMIHEAGHYFAARTMGMKATEFFFGFGPKLWSTTRGERQINSQDTSGQS